MGITKVEIVCWLCGKPIQGYISTYKYKRERHPAHFSCIESAILIGHDELRKRRNLN